jgi:HEAT repeat protein
MLKHEVWRRMCLGSSLTRLACALLFLLTASAGPVARAQVRQGLNGNPRARALDVDRRVGWVHWWEANRDTYLMQALEREGRAQRQAPADRGLVQQVVDALIESTNLDDSKETGLTRLRVASAMSLGRIGTDAAVGRLIELTQDEQREVRTAAWLGLGASGHERARAKLLDPAGELDDPGRAARFAALGLLKAGDEQAIDTLKRGLVNAPLALEQRMILQSLRLLQAPDLGGIGREALVRTRSVTVASEAILAMGDRPHPDDAEMVLSLLRGGPPATHLGFSRSGLSAETCFAAAQVLDGYAGILTSKRLRRVLKEFVFKTTPNGDRDFYRGAALLSLASLAQREDEQVFEDALDGRTRVLDGNLRQTTARGHVTGGPVTGSPGLVKERDFIRRDDPIRGYAAIAIGMYLKRFSEPAPQTIPQQKIVPIRYEHETQRANRRLLDQLSRTLANQRELPDVRAAAAMGLGLSGHPDAAGLIAQGLEQAKPQEIMVIGYGTLAMALLGDDRAAIPAARYLEQLDEARGDSRFASDNATEDVLGLRAMALALGLIGGDKAASALSDAWATDPWLSLESAKALSWVEDDSLAEPLTASLLGNPNEPEAVLAALGLGEMFESARPSRLSRLSVGSNYALSPSNTPGTQRAASNRDRSINRNEDSSSMCASALQNSLAGKVLQAPANVYLYEILLGP